jgi:hypothetical protein
MQRPRDRMRHPRDICRAGPFAGYSCSLQHLRSSATPVARHFRATTPGEIPRNLCSAPDTPPNPPPPPPRARPREPSTGRVIHNPKRSPCGSLRQNVRAPRHHLRFLPFVPGVCPTTGCNPDATRCNADASLCNQMQPECNVRCMPHFACYPCICRYLHPLQQDRMQRF